MQRLSLFGQAATAQQKASASSVEFKVELKAEFKDELNLDDFLSLTNMDPAVSSQPPLPLYPENKAEYTAAPSLAMLPTTGSFASDSNTPPDINDISNKSMPPTQTLPAMTNTVSDAKAVEERTQKEAAKHELLLAMVKNLIGIHALKGGGESYENEIKKLGKEALRQAKMLLKSSRNKEKQDKLTLLINLNNDGRLIAPVSEIINKTGSSNRKLGEIQKRIDYFESRNLKVPKSLWWKLASSYLYDLFVPLSPLAKRYYLPTRPALPISRPNNPLNLPPSSITLRPRKKARTDAFQASSVQLPPLPSTPVTAAAPIMAPLGPVVLTGEAALKKYGNLFGLAPQATPVDDDVIEIPKASAAFALGKRKRD